MMEFHFDSEENIQAVQTPSVKVLNDVAKLWISDQCAELCKWKKDDRHLITHDINVISGNIIHNPRMIIHQHSLLLKVETKTGRILSAWVAGESKEENTYTCIRIYMILLLDENNNPLHEVPLQLTARGSFQYEVDQKLCEFESVIAKAYNYMCVFISTFKSMMRGEGS